MQFKYEDTENYKFMCFTVLDEYVLDDVQNFSFRIVISSLIYIIYILTLFSF